MLAQAPRPDTLSSAFAALADPTRRAILARLAEGPATVNELAAPLPLSLPAVSRHIKVLERAGLITRTVEAQWRRCAIRPEGLQSAAAWIAHYQRFWAGQLDRLGAYLDATAADADTPTAKESPDASPDQ